MFVLAAQNNSAIYVIQLGSWGCLFSSSFFGSITALRWPLIVRLTTAAAALWWNRIGAQSGGYWEIWFRFDWSPSDRIKTINGIELHLSSRNILIIHKVHCSSLITGPRLTNARDQYTTCRKNKRTMDGWAKWEGPEMNGLSCITRRIGEEPTIRQDHP